MRVLAEEKMGLSLVGKILSTKKISKEAFQALIPSIWKVSKGVTVEQCGENTYVFCFNDEYERRRVLNGRPWSFNNSLIVLEEPIGAGELNKMKFDHVSFWIQFHNLPLST